jgi:pteridine reductase
MRPLTGRRKLNQRFKAQAARQSFFQADLSSARGPALLVEEVTGKFGSLSVVINSAAVMERTPLGAVTPEAWDAMFALNLRAPFLVAQAAAPLMRDDGARSSTSRTLPRSRAGRPTSRTRSARRGIVKMTSSLARVLAPSIRVNAIAPGAVLLPDDWEEESGERLVLPHPLQRLGDPETSFRQCSICYAPTTSPAKQSSSMAAGTSEIGVAFGRT